MKLIFSPKGRMDSTYLNLKKDIDDAQIVALANTIQTNEFWDGVSDLVSGGPGSIWNGMAVYKVKVKKDVTGGNFGIDSVGDTARHFCTYKVGGVIRELVFVLPSSIKDKDVQAKIAEFFSIPDVDVEVNMTKLG